ncbi:LysM peptidoglycan-binding domain-containing protein [Brevibacillus reuszeri]|uniref:LysM peptidoglycan-binding domain-containing protein n=1 Tax=Brevibacillus reuszeri TaxID=54915 RepID=UPI003D2032D1
MGFFAFLKRQKGGLLRRHIRKIIKVSFNRSYIEYGLFVILNRKVGRIIYDPKIVRIKGWVVLVLMAISFYVGSISSGNQEKELLVPESPNYTVKQGDTLYKIAKTVSEKNDIGITEAIKSIKRVNEEKGNKIEAVIYPGQDIYVPISI